MKQDDNTRIKLERLEGVLDTFGADAERWPAAERVALQAFVRTDRSAKQLFVEARALAQVMKTASAGNASDALRTHIVTAAMEDRTREATIVPFIPKLGRTGKASKTIPIQRAVSMWPAAALAASFAFGLYMGVTGVGGAAVEDVLRVAITDISGSDAGGISWLEDSAAGDGGGLL